MDIKEEIKNSIRLSEVIGKNISLKRRDKSNYIALCPFHKEKTPSFNVSDDKGFFHCFGCGKNGDIFTYVMEMENVTFVDALKKLADQAGINYNYDKFSENPKLKNQLHLLKQIILHLSFDLKDQYYLLLIFVFLIQMLEVSHRIVLRFHLKISLG